MAQKPRKIRTVFSDLHLGEGALKNNKPNPLELFEADEEFYNTISSILAKYPPEILELDFLGDTFDFLRVKCRGRVKAEPDENSAIEKIEKIFAAHPKVIGAMRLALSRGVTVKFFFGNHDLELAWPNVQNFIRRELTKGWAWTPDPYFRRDPMAFHRQIKFALCEEESGVLFSHGNGAEPVHAMPEELFFKKQGDKPLTIPLLRHPYGAHILTDQAVVLTRGNWIFKGNPLIGRVEPHSYIIWQSLWKNWWFAICAIILWLVTPIRHRFSRRWWVKKYMGLWNLFVYNWSALVIAAYNALRGKDFTDYPKKLLKERDDLEMIVLGHIHIFHRETTPAGTIVFPGPWCTTYAREFPEIKLIWKRFRRLEKALKTLRTVKRLFNKKYAAEYAPQKRDLYSFAVCKFYNDGHKEVKLMRFNPEKNILEELI